MYKFLLLFVLSACFCVSPSVVSSTVTVSENFNDVMISSPLQVFQPGGYCTSGCNYSNEVSKDGVGYSLKGDHANSDELRMAYDQLGTQLKDGLYFRYWVYYPFTYLFPGEQGVLENIKMLKFAGSEQDIEFIYKDSSNGGPSSLQLYWMGADGTITGNGTGTGSAALGIKLGKGVWHKIEVYMKLGSLYPEQEIHVQVDDYDVYQDSGASVNFRLPASSYTGTTQFASIRASNSPPSGSGYYYFDNVTIVYNEGDLCNYEPPEPGGVQPADTTPPSDVTNANVVEGNGQIALTWTNPNDTDYRGSLVRYTTGSVNFPATYQDGTLGCDEQGTPGASDGCTITGLENGTQHNFSIFTYDTSGNYSHTVNIIGIPRDSIDPGGGVAQAWSASEQTGDQTWSDSTALWTVRVLVQGSHLVPAAGANLLALAFQGRISGSYQVTRISIAEKVVGGGVGDVVDSSWIKVPVTGGTQESWENDVLTVAPENELLTEYVPFSVDVNKDYYITFQCLSPSDYLVAPTGYYELYFDDGQMAAMARTVDWNGTGYKSYGQRIHGVSKIFIKQGLLPPQGFQLSQ